MLQHCSEDCQGVWVPWGERALFFHPTHPPLMVQKQAGVLLLAHCCSQVPCIGRALAAAWITASHSLTYTCQGPAQAYCLPQARLTPAWTPGQPTCWAQALWRDVWPTEALEQFPSPSNCKFTGSTHAARFQRAPQRCTWGRLG